MKTNKNYFNGIGFLLGTLFGVMAMVLVSFNNDTRKLETREGIISITSTQANNYCKNYLTKAENFNQILKGFMVDKAQLLAMNSISSENPGLAGFRIYMGKDSNNAKIGIVVGIDINGRDAVNNSIFNTDSPSSGPCPTVCDNSSPIISDN
ncbi:MAG TPA: hypothetical protein VK590_14320 [Saprospiraceae bacterium]|nr:hypothetical protein [Saprospiraceae bacterium]